MREQNAVAMIIPAHTLKGEARQFGAEPLATIAELIEQTARLCVETHRFPDELVPEVVQLKKLFNETIELFDKATNPLLTRPGSVSGFGRKVGTEGFGRVYVAVGLGLRLFIGCNSQRARLRQAHSNGPYWNRSSHGFDQASISSQTSGTTSHASKRDSRW